VLFADTSCNIHPIAEWGLPMFLVVISTCSQTNVTVLTLRGACTRNITGNCSKMSEPIFSVLPMFTLVLFIMLALNLVRSVLYLLPPRCKIIHWHNERRRKPSAKLKEEDNLPHD
jgi:hypothetical protein